MFLHPERLLLLVLIPVWWLFLRRPIRWHALEFDDLRSYGGQTGLFRGFIAYLPESLRMMAGISLVVAFARPVAPAPLGQLDREGVDLMLVVDTSDSMQALDFEWEGKRRNRLEVAQRVLHAFVGERRDDRLGLIIFAKTAFLQCPLTMDHRIVQDFIARMRPGMGDGSATAIGDGLAVAVKRLRASDSKTRLVILLTDGRNNAGRLPPATAIALAKEFGIRVYTIGIGGKGEAPVLVDTPLGRHMVYQKVDIDEELLATVAKETGGEYFRATDTPQLQQIYQTIDRMEKTRLEAPEQRPHDERFKTWVAISLLALLCDVMLSLTPWRRLPA